MPADHRATSSSSVISVADYERAAEACIEPAAFGCYAGGAGDEITMSDNIAAWRAADLDRSFVGAGYWNSGRA